MIVIGLPHEDLKKYLLHVFATYTSRGLPPEELGVAADLYGCLMASKELIEPPVPESMGKASLVAMSPEGVTLEFERGNEG